MESAPGEASLCDLLIVGAGPAGLVSTLTHLRSQQTVKTTLT